MVGSAIKRTLIKKGYKNLIYPKRKELNLLNFGEVEDWFKKNNPNIVILAAAKVGGFMLILDIQGILFLKNLKIQNNVIENSWRYKVKRFLFLGSSCIYPKLAKQPIKEEYFLTGSLEKTNESYALAKIAGIKLCSSLKTQYGFDAISLMPTNLYGQGDNYHHSNSHVLPSLIRKFYEAKIRNQEKVVCWGTGSPKREFLYVDDFAEASTFVLENISSQNKIFFDNSNNFNGLLNVGVGLDITIKELATLISSIVGYKGEIIWDSSMPDGTPRKLLDVSKINNLGWSAQTSLEKGIKLTLNSYIEELKTKSIRI